MGKEETYFENLRECFDDAGIFITVHLNSVDECNFGLRTVAEWFDDIRETLYINYVCLERRKAVIKTRKGDVRQSHEGQGPRSDPDERSIQWKKPSPARCTGPIQSRGVDFPFASI